jgi:arylsulfatase A-like enzyme
MVGALTLQLSCKRSPASDHRDVPKPEDRRAQSARAVPDSILDIVHDIDRCAIGHLGVLVDFGEPALRADLGADMGRPARRGPNNAATSLSDSMGGAKGSARTVKGSHDATPARDGWVEHDGATWLQVRSRTISASFYWPAVAGEPPDASVYVEGRLRGIAARSAVVAIDGKTVGAFPLRKSADRTAIVRPSAPLVLTTGGHDLTVRFSGGSRAIEPLAEVDWVHVGTGQPTESYSAPTIADALQEVSVGGSSLRALSLRAPGFVRCSSFIPANATLEASLSIAGAGDADVEARLVRDRRSDIVLGVAHVGGGTEWLPWSVPIAGLEGSGALAAIELSVRRASKGARVVFGAPRLVVPGATMVALPPVARSAVLVVLGSTAARALAPWGGAHPVSELSRIAAAGVVFTGNRASSSLVSAVMGSMVTGLSPSLEALVDPTARLPKGPTTVEDACRQAGIATAMFTANPTSGSAYGFDRGWDTFVEHSPVEDVPATRVFDEAAEWIDAHKTTRFFVVVHARGGHPPWDATPDDLKNMPPQGYFGAIEPGRAAEALRKARKHSSRLKDDDRTRAWALYDRAVDVHDDALGRLMSALQGAGLDDSTLEVVTSDVATSEALPVPFLDTDSLDEPLLATPLVVRWPRAAALAGRRTDIATSSEDVARTIVGALGLTPPSGFGGADLTTVVQSPSDQRPVLATRGDRESFRWGPFVVLEAHRREVRMCDLSLDPTCTADVRATAPLALGALRRSLLEVRDRAEAAAVEREPVVLDGRTSAALVRWGLSRSASETDDK